MKIDFICYEKSPLWVCHIAEVDGLGRVWRSEELTKEEAVDKAYDAFHKDLACDQHTDT
jgi:hypothetical protein